MPRRNGNARGSNKGVPQARRRKLVGPAAARRKTPLDKKAKGTGVDFQGKSRLESSFGAFLRGRGIPFDYESEKYPYQLKPQTYLPDFKMEGMIFETKGYFPNADRQKMRAVLACNPNIDLYMVFSNPDKPIRKGSKTTYGEWCTEQGIPWVGINELKRIIEEDPKGYVNTLRRRKAGMEFREYYTRGIGTITRDGKAVSNHGPWSEPAIALAAVPRRRSKSARPTKS